MLNAESLLLSFTFKNDLLEDNILPKLTFFYIFRGV